MGRGPQGRKGGGLNSYIVRVYREGGNKSRELVGIVEEVGGDGKKAFTNIDELWEILSSVRKRRKDESKQTPCAQKG